MTQAHAIQQKPQSNMHGLMDAPSPIKTREQTKRPTYQIIKALRQEITSLERHKTAAHKTSYNRTHTLENEPYQARTGDEATPLRFGLTEIDMTLPWGGLNPYGLHEIKPSCYKDQAASLGLSLALLSQRVRHQSDKPILIVMTEPDFHEYGHIYGPSLKQYGLSDEKILIVKAKNTPNALWAIEEGLGSNAVAAVFGQIPLLETLPARRLSLAASSFKTPCFILSNHQTQGPGSALTRWRVETAPNKQALGKENASTWQLHLERCKHGLCGGRWTVGWCHDTLSFHRAA